MDEAERKALHEVIEFTVHCRMKRRWAKQFCAMLDYMQRLGSWGSSRNVTIMADGDGDFRPEFVFVGAPVFGDVEPVDDTGGNHTYDAG